MAGKDDYQYSSTNVNLYESGPLLWVVNLPHMYVYVALELK